MKTIKILMVSILLILFITVSNSCQKGQLSDVIPENSTSTTKFASTQDVLKSFNSSRFISTVKDKMTTASFRADDNDEPNEELETIAMEELLPVYEDFQNYAMVTYPSKGTIDDETINDPDFCMLMILHKMAEENNFQPINEGVTYRPDGSGTSVIQCVMGILGGIGNVVSLYNDYVALFNGGASWSSVWSVLKKTIKRQFGWFAAAYAIYEIGDDCFNWW